MARYDYATPFVQKALSQGIGPTAGLRMAREQGLRVRDATWFRAYGLERNNIALQWRQRDLPLNRRPDASEIGEWQTVKKRGYAYRVSGILRDRETGATKETIITVTSRNLISRGAAIRLAMDAFIDPEEKYPATLMAAYTRGVFQMIPEPEGE